MEMQRDGTLMVRGDPVQLQERLRQGGVERVLRRKGGVLVGLDQVHKARQLLQQPPSASAWAGPSRPSRPSLSGQQFSRSAPPSPDRPSQARGLPSQPATVQSVRAAVAKLTNSMGLLAEGRGRMVVATSADIQAHWEPLIGEVDMGSQDTGLAQGFFDPRTCSRSRRGSRWSAIGMSGCFGCAAWAHAHASSRGVQSPDFAPTLWAVVLAGGLRRCGACR